MEDRRRIPHHEPRWQGFCLGLPVPGAEPGTAGTLYKHVCEDSQQSLYNPSPHWSLSQPVLASLQRQWDHYLLSTSLVLSVDSAAF